MSLGVWEVDAALKLIVRLQESPPTNSFTRKIIRSECEIEFEERSWRNVLIQGRNSIWIINSAKEIYYKNSSRKILWTNMRDDMQIYAYDFYLIPGILLKFNAVLEKIEEFEEFKECV